MEDTDCLVQVPASDELDITKAITMAAWIFPLEDQNDSNVMGRRTAGNQGGYCLQWSGFGAAKLGLPYQIGKEPENCRKSSLNWSNGIML